MKSERRHELQHNELLDWLRTTGERIKPYQNMIIGVALLAAVGIAAYSLWSRRSAARDTGAWEAMDQAMQSDLPGYARQYFRNPQDFDKVAEQHPDTSAGDWAAVMAADLHRLRGTEALFSDKATAKEELNAAVEKYKEALKSRSSMLRERATFGLAQALEALGNRLDDAIARYKEVTQQWPKGMFASVAANRVQELQKEDTKHFYDQFASATMQPRTPLKDELPAMPGARSPLGPPPADPPADPSFGLQFPKSLRESDSDKKTGTSAEKTPDKTAEKTSGKTAEKAPEKTSDKTVEKAPEKTSDKTAEKTGEKGK
jgi:hypothetical protein